MGGALEQPNNWSDLAGDERGVGGEAREAARVGGGHQRAVFAGVGGRRGGVARRRARGGDGGQQRAGR